MDDITRLRKRAQRLGLHIQINKRRAARIKDDSNWVVMEDPPFVIFGGAGTTLTEVETYIEGLES